MIVSQSYKRVRGRHNAERSRTTQLSDVYLFMRIGVVGSTRRRNYRRSPCAPDQRRCGSCLERRRRAGEERRATAREVEQFLQMVRAA